MAEIEEVIKLKVEGTGDGIKSVKSLRQELRETQQDAIAAARKFGEFSPEAAKAAQKVAKLKDEMGDFQQRVAALNPDKFQAIAGVVQGVAGGIAAAQGAMALFGAESEDTQKALIKVQGALAFSQGVQQILDLKNSFGAVASNIVGKLIPALMTLKGAMIATGIGALVVGLGYLITKFQETGQSAADAKKKVDEFAESAEKAVNAIEKRNAVEIQQAKQRGASEKELNDIRDYNYEMEILRLQNLRGGEMSEKVRKDKIEQIEYARELNRETFKAAQADKDRERQKKLGEDLKALREKQDAESLAAAKELQAQFDALRKANEEREQTAAETLAAVLEEQRTLNFNARQKELDDLEKWYDEKRLLLVNGGESTSELTTLYESKVANVKDGWRMEDQAKTEKDNADRLAKLTASHDKEVAAEKAKNDAIKQARELAYNQTSSILGSISQLFGQATAAGKAAAIIQVGFDEARAIGGALANSQSPLDPTNAATGGLAGVAKFIAISASVLSGFARIKQILGANTPSPTAAGGGGISSIPVQSGYLPTSDQQAGQLGANNRVYVLEGDITKTQGRVRTNRKVSII